MIDKSHFIKLTIGVYKVSGLFPKREPLKFLLRKKADEVLASLVAAQFQPRARALEQVIKQITVLGVYLQIAESQNWVKPENFWLLKTEYQAIEEEAKQMLAVENGVQQANSQLKFVPTQPSKAKTAKLNYTPDFSGLKDRHKKIIQLLRQKASAQIRDFNKVLPEVTKRTLRRDLDFLLQKGLVARFGDKSKTEYKIKI